MSRRRSKNPLKTDVITATDDKRTSVISTIEKAPPKDSSCGYDLNFVEDVAEYLTCAACSLVLRNPVHLVDCGHRLCQRCFQDLKKDTSQLKVDFLCPQDKIKVNVDKVFEDKGTFRIIMNLKVRCERYDIGCQWTGEFHRLEAHLKKCNFGDGEGAFTLFNQLQKRLEKYEADIAGKDKDLQTSRQQLSQKNEEVTALKKTVDTSQERIVSLEKQVEKYSECEEKISVLEKEVAKYKQSHEKIVLLEKDIEQCKESVKKRPLPSTAECDASGDPTSAKTSKLSSELSSAQSFQQGIIHKAFALNKGQMDKINKQVKTLVEKVTCMETLTANKSVVFKWLIDNYEHQKLIGKEVTSPKFYTALDGHCCQLFVQWFGDKKGRLGLYFQICRDPDNKNNKIPFAMRIDIDIVDKYGNMDNEKITLSDIKEHQHLFEIKDDENASKGYGFPDFLYVPRLNDFIINDSLTIKCTLSP